MLGRVAITVLTAVAAMFLSCSPNVKTSAGSKIKNVAVVEAEVDAQSGADASLNPAEVRQITAVLRKEAVKNLPQGKYNIMTTETVMSQGSAVLEECSDENCVIKVGAAIGADYIVRGTVSKFGTMLTVSVDMYETNDGNLVASSELVRSENIVELLDKTAAASEEMYRKFVNPQGFAAKQKQAAPVAPPPPAVAVQQPVYQAPQTAYQRPAQTYQPPAPPPAVAVQQPVYQAQTPPPSVSYGSLADSRDGKTYKTVVIGGKTWMAENLNYQTASGSWCYENNNSNCEKYGRLYDWKTARTVCPAGWHLPSRNDWDDLGRAAGGERYLREDDGTIDWQGASRKLKARSGWNSHNRTDGSGGNGTDDYGFSALPGGQRGSGGGFGNAGYNGYWWTATEGWSNYAYRRYIYYNLGSVSEDNIDKSSGFSARCVADN